MSKSGAWLCVALVAVATVAAATEEGLAAAAEKDEKIALLTQKATKLEAAVDAMKTLSPETKRQVAVELSAAEGHKYLVKSRCQVQPWRHH